MAETTVDHLFLPTNKCVRGLLRLRLLLTLFKLENFSLYMYFR